MQRQKLLRWAGYGAFALFSLFISFYLTFPAEAVAARLAQEVQKQSRGQWTLTYKDASSYHLSGLSLEGVALQEAGAPGEAMRVTLDAVRGRLRLAPLFLARLSVDAEVLNGDGSLAVRWTPRSSAGGSGPPAMDVRLEADDFDFASAPFLAKMAGLPLGGKMNGSLDASWENDVRKSTGSLELNIEAANLGPGAVQGLTLPNVSLGSLVLAAEAKDGKFKITSFKQQGGNVNLRASGNLQLRQPLTASGVEACVQFKADPAFLNSNPKLKSIVQLAEVQLRKDGEGFLMVPLQGALNGVRVNPGTCR